MTVTKRDGRKESFNRDKIINAVEKAFISVDGELDDYVTQKASEIADYIKVRVDSDNELNDVESIQDMVEERLMASKRKDVAREYVLYRKERSRFREFNTTLMKNINVKVMGENNECQNANVDELSFGGRKGEADSVLMKEMALNMMSPKIRYNHLHNRSYTHDMASYILGDHNCFNRNTRFITDEGIKAFSEFHDGDMIKVLDRYGVWRPATVRFYGRKPMNKVSLERCGKIIDVVCTGNHRWILKDGSVTENLKVGDSLELLCDITRRDEDISSYTKRELEMFCMGFIIGDGCDVGDSRVGVRLCNNKIAYVDAFKKCGYSVLLNAHDNGDAYCAKKAYVGKQSFLTHAVWNILSLEDRIAFFHGYISADGSKTKKSTKHVWTSDERVLQMVKDLAPLAGYHIFSISEVRGDTNFKTNRLLYDITLTTRHSKNNAWKVISIKKQPNDDYEAWCVEEPVTHSFTLEGGIVTGNCLSITFDDLLAHGFVVRNTDIRPANSVNTACQLVVVIFQIQSLQQFGGVSATHLDITLVIYVRKSFLKHYLAEYIKSLDDFKDFDLEDVMFESYVDDFGIERDVFDEWVDANKEKYLKELGLTEDDFRFDNEVNLDPRFYQPALYETIKETKQAIEGLFHNLCSLASRMGEQLPFSSINFGTDTSREGRMINKAILHGSLKGVGKYHKTPIFPCGIFTWDGNINGKMDTPNYDMYKLALKSTSRRLYPNYANNNWSTQKSWVEYDRKCKKEVLSKLEKEIPDFKNKLINIIKTDEQFYHDRLLLVINNSGDIEVSSDILPIELMSSMGCRTVNGADIWAKDSFEKNIRSLLENGTFYDDIVSAAQKDGRGNIAPATVIMPTLAMEADRDVEKFMKLLEEVIEETKDGLIERYNYICSQSCKSAKFMYENNSMVGYVPEEGIQSALRHGTLAIGQIGLAETLQLLIGCDHTEARGMELAKRIEQLFKDKCNEYKEKYKLNFGVYMTPAESLCYTSMKKFQEEYGVIENVSDKEFFTNSIHVPVWKEISPMEKIDIESQLTGYSSAGCITYVELDGAVFNNLEALEQIVNYAMEKDIPYFAINIPIDSCDDCGYSGEIGEGNACPECGSMNISFLRRVTGYLTGNYKKSFNKGKRQETQMRYKHSKKLRNWNR